MNWQLKSRIIWAIILSGLIQSAACSTCHTSFITRSLNIECDIFSPTTVWLAHIYLWEQMFEMPAHGDASAQFLCMQPAPLISHHSSSGCASSAYDGGVLPLITVQFVFLFCFVFWVTHSTSYICFLSFRAFNQVKRVTAHKLFKGPESSRFTCLS